MRNGKILVQRQRNPDLLFRLRVIALVMKEAAVIVECDRILPIDLDGKQVLGGGRFVLLLTFVDQPQIDSDNASDCNIKLSQGRNAIIYFCRAMESPLKQIGDDNAHDA